MALATKKSAGETKLTKMQSIMKLTGQGIRDQRNGNLYKRLNNANGDKLRDLERSKDEITDKILAHIDLAPNSKDSLKVRDVDAEKWNQTLAGFYGEIRDIDDTIEIYETIREEFFTPKTAAELAEDDLLGGQTVEEEIAE